MYPLNTLVNGEREQLARTLARATGVPAGEVYPFGDFTQFMEELLKILYRPLCRLVCAGHITPDVAIAADRAEVEIVEVLPASPFEVDVSVTLANLNSDGDIIYVANPNRVTGATFSLADLGRLASADCRGPMIVDERYLQYLGVTGLDLTAGFDDIIILRTFASGRDGRYTDGGYVIADERLIVSIRDSICVTEVSRTTRDAIMPDDSETAIARTREVHRESLRVATELTKLGIQCRITPTDFLLLRVACPKDVGNFLIRNEIAIENLDGYPLMRNYMRYHLGKRAANDGLLDAFERMPRQFYRSATLDGGAVKLHRRKSAGSGGNGLTREPHTAFVNRNKSSARKPAIASKSQEDKEQLEQFT